MPQSKQPARGKKAVTPRQRPSAAIDPKCTLPNICTFLDQLSPWLQLLNEDYTALRIAVCNVEKQAFSGTGVDARPPRFCSEEDNAPMPPMRLR